MTQEAINNLIAQRVTEALAEYETQRNSVVNGDTSHTTGTGPRTVRPTQECTYKDYLNCGPLKFNGTERVIGLTRWFERREYVSSISNCTAENQRIFLEESDEIERYVGGLPKMIQGNVMSYEPKSMQKAIESANDQMDQKLLGIADRQADNKRNRAANTNNNNNNNNYNNWRATTAYQGVPTCFDCGAQGNGNVMARAYGVGTAGGNPDSNVVI
nr:hypothetical protein [Tanacetum cinerariifolium]